MLPHVVRVIILQFHDEFNLIEKRHNMQQQIRYGYSLWMRHMGARGRTFYYRTEYSAKLSLRNHVLYPPYYNHEWEQFLFYFKLAQFLTELYNKKKIATPAELQYLLPP